MSLDPKERASAIWSTESAAVLGLSDRYTAAQVWTWKRGLADPPEGADAMPARLGLACQDGVARLHVEDTGAQLIPFATELRCEIDGVPLGSHFDYWNKTAQALHEVKFFALHRRREFGDAGSDVVPYDVLVQALHEMTVWNADDTGYGKANACEIDVVFGNVERAVFVIPYDLEARAKLLAGHAAFWKLVTDGEAPAPTSPEDARRIWSRSDGSEAIADGTTQKAHEALIGLRKQIKSMEAQRDEMELYLQRAMQSAATLKSPDGRVLATWKDVPTERVDVKRLRAEAPQLAAQYLNVTVSRRFLPKG